ncbi:DUF4142 domain-containing protein [Aridibaculum aurantiacum]|uniref:DUF4142 domain-containing protein n=1 Tax=Aridibaculum aurantiacum TaxID=2810307 RepID=UPI001A97B184|nr:DUF4142 domain-containing protein [Aridibaculum aurantiacum]
MINRLTKILLLAIVVFSSCQNVQQEEAQVVKLSGNDAELLINTYSNLLLTVKMAEEAVNRSALPGTRQLAITIRNDHQAMLDKLEDVANKHKADLPLDLTPQQLKQWQALVREKGIAFDKAYAAIVQENHDNNLVVLKSIMSKAENPSLQNVAKEINATAINHLQQGEELQELIENRRSRDTIMEITAVSFKQ